MHTSRYFFYFFYLWKLHISAIRIKSYYIKKPARIRITNCEINKNTHENKLERKTKTNFYYHSYYNIWSIFLLFQTKWIWLSCLPIKSKNYTSITSYTPIEFAKSINSSFLLLNIWNISKISNQFFLVPDFSTPASSSLPKLSHSFQSPGNNWLNKKIL